MKIRRLMTSVSASFEDFVNKVENHEAVAESVLEDLRLAAANARVQLKRVSIRLDRMETQCGELSEQIQQWQHRALECADRHDEKRAFECLRRAEHLEQQMESIEEQRKEHAEEKNQMRSRLTELEAALTQCQLRQSSLTARAAQIRAGKSLSQLKSADSAQSVFERWENVVLADEYAEAGEVCTTDSLDVEFSQTEADKRLREKLAVLKAGGV